MNFSWGCVVKRSHAFNWLAPLFLILLMPVDGVARVNHDKTGHPSFLSPHSAPIAVSGGKVFVTNTPADTVDVIDAFSHEIVARINVGVDPAGIAVRPDGMEVWVSNHVSDSVSVIDSNPASLTFLQVIATVQDFNPVTKSTRFDEPVGIAFASNEKAYVALSSENQVAVIDVASHQVAKYLSITAQDPRAIYVRGERLYVVAFESNNRTQISGCVNNIDGDLCTFDATEHVVTNNNVLSVGIVVDIVKNPKIPDRDLFIFDTATDQLVQTVQGVGTLLYGLVVDSTGQVFVSQTDARNDVNGRAGTFGDGLSEMENRAFLNLITRVDCSGSSCAVPQFMELEPAPPANPAPGTALATPYAIQISDDDTTLVVSAAGSNKLFTVDVASGEVLGSVTVGAVPRGIALESDPAGKISKVWVLNAAANTVSLVDVTQSTNMIVTDSIVMEDPTHPEVKRGRIAFNDANASTTGTFSCESCHPDGGTDQLLWVLNTPACSLPGCDQIPPRITMPIRGLRDTSPYHWDGIPGDPYGGINVANINRWVVPTCDLDSPESCTRDLVDGGLANTLCEVGRCPINDEGKDGALSAAERDDMAKFLLSVPYPPAQRRAYTNVLSQGAIDGFRLFHIDGDNDPAKPQPFVCGDCHRMPFWVSTNSPGTGMDAPTWRGAYDRWLILPQGRLNIIDFGFYERLTRTGTPERSVWRLSWANRGRFDPVWNMVLEGSTGFSGAFARSVTVSQSSVDAPLTTELLDALEQSAAEGDILLQAEGVFLNPEDEGEQTTPVELQFDRRVRGGSYVSRSDNDEAYTRAELVSLASEGRLLITLSGRLGARVDVENPQPALWSLGPNHVQRGRQVFPNLTGDNSSLTLSGRHIMDGAGVFIDGRRVSGTVSCQQGELPGCEGEVVEILLSARPTPAGMHFVQVQNPDGLHSNEFIVHTKDLVLDNCPDIPNPDQKDSDADGIGDRCDDDAFDFAINPGISGSWYDPQHDGEGWFVQVLDDNKAIVYWFTYSPPGVDGKQAQAWIGGVGEVVGSSIVVPAAGSLITNGASFGPGFDPQSVERYPWGKIVLSFSDCNGGVMYYKSDDLNFGSGSLDLTRVTQIDSLDCAGSAPAAPPPLQQADFTVTPSISGAWFDPGHDGEGWLLEVLADDRAVVSWFSYDSEGKQAWFLNTGSIEGNKITFDLLVPSGTDFGPTFNADELTYPPWGNATLIFDGCNSGTMSYDSVLPTYGKGELELTRITKLAGLECQ